MRNRKTLSRSCAARPTTGVAVMLTTILVTGQAVADDFPALRAGMWEFTRTVEMSTTSGTPQSIHTKKCTDPSSDFKRQNEMLAKGGCTFSPIARTGNTYTYSAACKMKGLSGTSKSVLTVESDSAYVIHVESNLGGENTRELLRAKRVGDCQP